ncbi:hypothetical protein YPPY98_1728, partial [Yersinia pestis PY-98]
MSVGIICSTS